MLLKMLSDSKKQLRKILLKKDENKDYMKDIEKELNILKIK